MTARLHLERDTFPTVPHSALREWRVQSDRAAAEMEGLLEGYAPISLAEMEVVSLLKRVDTKYVLHIGQLFQALSGLRDRYRVLEVQGRRLNCYHTLYFDPPDFQLYHQHHNGQRSRYKVRSREYVDSQLVYLEVKCKNNRDQTVKSRLRTGKARRAARHCAEKQGSTNTDATAEHATDQTNPSVFQQQQAQDVLRPQANRLHNANLPATF